MTNVIDYVPGNTLLHRLNPVAKLALAAALIVATFLADTYALLFVLLALTFALGAYARVVARLVSLLKVLVPLGVVMLVLQLVFVRGGQVLWGFVTTEGLVSGSKVCLRLLGVALPLLLVLMVTKLTDLANACVEVLHVPYRYAFTFTTALRFVPVFSQEMNAIMEAQTARGVEYDTKNPFRAAVRAAARELRGAHGRHRPRRRAARLLPAHAREQLSALPVCRARLGGACVLRDAHRPGSRGVRAAEKNGRVADVSGLKTVRNLPAAGRRPY